MDPKLVDTWMTLVDRYGVELGLLVLVLAFLWLSARFLANKVAVPIVTAHISFVQALEKNYTASAVSQQKLAETQIVLANNQDKVLEAVKTIPTAIAKQTTDLKQVFVQRVECPILGKAEVKSA